MNNNLGICEECHGVYDTFNKTAYSNKDMIGKYTGHEWATIMHYNGDSPAGLCAGCDDIIQCNECWADLNNCECNLEQEIFQCTDCKKYTIDDEECACDCEGE